MLEDGDYSDLVTYLTGLFSIKKIPEVAMDQYGIKYSSAVILQGMSGDSEYEITRYPEKDEREAVKIINLEVSGIVPDVTCKVSINWDWVSITPEIDEKDATAFVDKLDMSTFRYF
ncbi:hypothetical protein IX51_09735 [uncultured archaeon]|nr:hypothetical protein IX51_09735 [uncultured archaeon]